MHSRLALMILGVACLFYAGCGGQSLGPVTGKVTSKGQPVTEGTIIFNPISEGDSDPGKGAAGEIKSDGTYELGTFEPGDGALIGKHKVTYSAPVRDSDEGPPVKNYKVPADLVVEVTSGKNDIPIELVPSP